MSGLVGGDGMKMRQYTFRGCAMTGGYVSEVIAEALSMAESNACLCAASSRLHGGRLRRSAGGAAAAVQI